MKPKKAKYSGMSRDELLLLCINDVITELLAAHKEGKDVNLNKTKTRLASKYCLETSPRLVDIIAAVPSQYKKAGSPALLNVRVNASNCRSCFQSCAPSP